MKGKVYPEYKDSGVEWLGEVPGHWEVKRSDGFVSSDKIQISPDDFAEKQVFHYSIPVVQETGTGQLEYGETIASAKQVIRKPVILVAKLNPRKATICLAKPQDTLTVCSTEFVALNPDKCDIRFLEYLVQTEIFRQGLDSKVQSVTRSHQRANPADIYKFWNAWPLLPEQTAIAEFLDRETGRIDELVGKKRELIERLKEKRSALTSRTVTRGLPADLPPESLARLEEIAGEKLQIDCPLTPSNHPWVNDIPKHWKLERLKHISTLYGRIGFRGYSTDDLVLEGEGAISMSPSNMVGGKIRFEKCTWLSWAKYHESPEIKINDGDIVMVKTGSTLGKVAFVDAVPHPMTINPQLMIFKNVKCCRRYLFYFVSSTVVQDVIPLHNTGSTIPTMTQEGIGNLPVPMPPRSEQTAIAAYLDEETAKIDTLIAKVETAIDRLQEYRSALITAAVTGKMDVREALSGKRISYPETQPNLRWVAEGVKPL